MSEESVTDEQVTGESTVGDVADVVESETVEEAVHVFEHDVEALLAERDSFRDIAQRLQADFENYRKRVAQQSADDIDRATGRMAEALLPVLDACEAAFVTNPDQVGPLLNVLLGELRKLGLEGMDLNGKPFDPQLSEAVMHEPGDGGESVVADEIGRAHV